MIDLSSISPQIVDIRPETKRIPPGQHVASRWPLLDLGIRPKIALEDWRLMVDGCVERPLQLNFSDLLALPQYETLADWHCVTTWSMLDNRWLGVRLSDVLSLAAPKEEARHLIFEAYDGYTTNIPLEVALEPGSLIVYGRNGELLSHDHGGPFRTIITSRYAWKSAKWIRKITLSADDHPGFWEVRGYHNNADFLKEERFS